jgi:quinol monooxygenase YgiN
MSGPFIFIATHRIKAGQIEAFAADWRKLVDAVEASEPRLIAFNTYANEDGTEVVTIHVHPDVESMLFHMQVARQHVTDAYQDLLETTTSIQVLGAPNEAALQMFGMLAGPGEPPPTIMPRHLGGFTRPAAQQP